MESPSNSRNTVSAAWRTFLLLLEYKCEREETHFVAVNSTEQNRDIDHEDLVVWYTLGKNHVTRPEDWPVLPVQMANLKLTPDNFFDQSEAIDVHPEHVINEGCEIPSRDEFQDETDQSMQASTDDD